VLLFGMGRGVANTPRSQTPKLLQLSPALHPASCPRRAARRKALRRLTLACTSQDSPGTPWSNPLDCSRRLAGVRAAESARPDHLINDPLAGLLLQQVIPSGNSAATASSY
jgi:hypothetical protein